MEAFEGVVYDEDGANPVADALGNNKAAFLKGHGPLTVGGSVDSAAFWLVTLERSCKAQLLAEATGDVHPIDPEHVEMTAGQVGRELDGWDDFQSMYEWILNKETELLK